MKRPPRLEIGPKKQFLNKFSCGLAEAHNSSIFAFLCREKAFGQMGQYFTMTKRVV